MSEIKNFIRLREIYFDKSQATNCTYRFVKDDIFINPSSIQTLSYDLLEVDGQKDVIIFKLLTSAGWFSGESKELENVFYNEEKP